LWGCSRNASLELEPTPEFKRLIEKEISGEMTMDDIKTALDKKYKIKK